MHVRVRYADCDMQGHVFNAHYMTWFDTAHTEALRETLGDYGSIVARGIELVVAEANVRYRVPARFDDELAIDVTFGPLGTTSQTSDFVVQRGADLIAEGSLRHVCVDARSFAKTPWPGWVRAALDAAKNGG